MQILKINLLYHRKCVDGKLKGKELRPLIHGNHFAFAWFAFEPECEVYE